MQVIAVAYLVGKSCAGLSIACQPIHKIIVMGRGNASFGIGYGSQRAVIVILVGDRSAVAHGELGDSKLLLTPLCSVSASTHGTVPCATNLNEILEIIIILQTISATLFRLFFAMLYCSLLRE